MTSKNEYTQSKLMPGLWTSHTKLIQFWLVLDAFGIKYMGREHAEHLKQILGQIYEIATDWEGKKYVELTLECDRKNK